jgi:5-methylcytosine-specific restriction endonuclease McrA
MRRVLLLNSTYEPIKFIPDKKAMVLILKGRAQVVGGSDGGLSVWSDVAFNTVTARFSVPATLRLNKRASIKWRMPKFRKKVLFNRDGWCCQYCGCRVNRDTAEVEHVLPTSRGGGSSWQNCATACRPCNKSKANRTPEEAGMKLLAKPRMPHPLHFWDVFRCDEWHNDWDAYIPNEVIDHRSTVRSKAPSRT